MLLLLFLLLVFLPFLFSVCVYVWVLYDYFFEENDRLSHTLSDFNTQIIIDKDLDNVYYISDTYRKDPHV